MPTENEPVLFTRQQAGKPIVVVVGCGFGGLQAAMHIAKLDVELVLIDRTNHHLFQPLLYQVSTAALWRPRTLPLPFARFWARASQCLRRVSVEVDRCRQGRETGGLHPAIPARIVYDYLLLATGSAYAWFGHDEWSKLCGGAENPARCVADSPAHPGILRLGGNAATIRPRCKALTSFIIIGGGPTGVELAGSLGELARSTLKSRVPPHRSVQGTHRARGCGLPASFGEFPAEAVGLCDQVGA